MANAELVKKHRQWVESADFIHTLDVVMLQFVAEQSQPTDMSTAASSQLRLQGAKDFVRLFLGFSDELKPRKPLPDINLTHR